MNSRQRIEAALNFQQPDRIPIDLGGIRASGINAVVYAELKRRMGIDTATKIHDNMQILAELELEVLDALHVDIVPLEAATADWAWAEAHTGIKRRLFCGQDVYFPPNTDIRTNSADDWELYNVRGECFARMPEGGYYFDFARPTMSAAGIDPEKFQPADTVSDAELESLAAHARRLHTQTDKALIGWGASISMFGLSALLSDNITQGSLDDWLCMLMVEKDTANDMMARYVDAVIKRLTLYHQAVGDMPVAWGVASDDAGTQKGGLIAPELFVEMIVPHYRRLCDWVHTHTKWKTFLHSCGSVYDYIPHWIDAGIDILNPVQISAANMEPERLMNDFGGKVVFWGGGCDTQHVLPLGTPDEVAAHVRANMDIFASGPGGYIFNQVHNIQQDVPVENVEAMFSTAYEYGQQLCK